MTLAQTKSSSLESTMRMLGEAAKSASAELALAAPERKIAALHAMAKAIRDQAGVILAANAEDMKAAEARGLSSALLDRLKLNDGRVEAMAKGLEEIAAQPDPVGRLLAEWTRPNGLKISRVSVPLGVIGIIYESRPNVAADAGGLCLKSGNAAILRGGSESAKSSAVIIAALQSGLKAAGLPEAAIQAVPTTDREAVGIMLRMDDCIDLIIPRGGRGLIERVAAESRIPVLKHLDGLCHTYVHAKADPAKAREIVLNAKMRRTGVCGATETLLIDRGALRFAEPIIADLVAAGCEVRGDDEALKLHDKVKMASSKDWDTEYLDAIIAVPRGRRHGRCDRAHQPPWLAPHRGDPDRGTTPQRNGSCARSMPASCLVNASTQFADGGEFRHGRRNRHLHRQAACARSGRRGTAHQLQISRPRQRPSAAVTGDRLLKTFLKRVPLPQDWGRAREVVDAVAASAALISLEEPRLAPWIFLHDWLQIHHGRINHLPNPPPILGEGVVSIRYIHRASTPAPPAPPHRHPRRLLQPGPPGPSRDQSGGPPASQPRRGLVDGLAAEIR